MEYVRHWIEATQRWAGPRGWAAVFAVGRTWQTTRTSEDATWSSWLAIPEVAVYAGEHGIVLCLEPLNRFETSFINLASQAIDLVDRVNHPACGIMLDTFHMNIEERSLGDGHPRHRVPAQPSETPARTTAAHQAPGTSPGMTLHMPAVTSTMTVPWSSSRSRKVTSIACAAAIWRLLAESQDALAEGGLPFSMRFDASNSTVEQEDT